jgi:hypothetical protein
MAQMNADEDEQEREEGFIHRLHRFHRLMGMA